MKIGFWFDYDQTYTFCKVFNELKRRVPSAVASGFVLNDRYWQHAVDTLPAGSHLIRFFDCLAKGLSYEPTSEELKDFSNFDEKHRLARVAYSDRHLKNYTHEELNRLYVSLIKEFRCYIEMERPDCFVFNCVASQFPHLFYLLLKEAKVKVIIPFHFGIEDLMYICDNPYFECSDIWQTFEKFKSGEIEVPVEGKAWAEGFIAHVREGRPAYATNVNEMEQQKFRYPGPRRIAAYIHNYFKYYTTDPHQPSILSKSLKVLDLRYNRARTRQYFQPFDAIDGRNYVYFPLHYEPEIATLIFSQMDQISVIDLVSRQLPVGWVLAIKEHPAMLGQRRHTFFPAIMKRYPNVLFIDPAVSSQKMARLAKVVLTLNGTVTLESLILGTPPIFLAQARFGGFGLGTFTNNLIDFGGSLSEALSKKVTDTELIAMLVSIWSRCRRYDMSEPLGRPHVLAPKNIEAIVSAMLDRYYERAS